MSGKNEEKSFWVWAQLDEDVHTALLEISTETGKHPKVLIEIAVEDYILQWTASRKEKGLLIPGKVELEAIVIEERRRQVLFNQIKQLAYHHSDTPTDESAERLARACELAGVSVELILEQVSNKPIGVDMMTEGSTLNTAELYLINTMTPGEIYQSTEIITAGENRGIKKYLINEAKRKLGIRSRRESGSWVWILPKKESGISEEQAF